MSNGRPPTALRLSTSGAALFVAALAYFGGLARYGYHRAEDGDILQLIYRTAHGQQPYIDFLSGYTPLFFYWHAALLRLFSENLMAIRWSLVVANSLTVWGLYTLGRATMPAIFALVAPLAYVAIIPASRGEFCAFNVPYPAWYTTWFSVAAALAMVRWARHGRPGAAAVAGIAAGLAFSFKPNAGLFALLGAALVLVCLVPAPPRRPGRWLWWAVTLGLVAGVIGVFGGQLISREARLFLWPIFALVALRIVHRDIATSRGEPLAPRFVAACLALGLGFASVTVPWLVYFFARLGWERFIHEVLFIGSGYEPFFFLPFHAATKWDYGMVLCCAALVGLAWCVRKGRLRPGIPLVVLGGGALACVVYVARFAPMPEGFERAVVSRVRDLSFSLCLLALWGGVGVLGRAWSVAASRRRPLPPADTAMVTILAPALAMFLGVYPRSDFMHLTISVAATLVLGALLLNRVVTMLNGALGRRAALAVRLGFVAPVFVAIVVMIAPTARLWLELRGLGGVRFVSLALPRAPVVMEEGRWRRVAELRAAVNYLEAATGPGDSIFPFPDLNLLCFLAGRQNPARAGYFQPGWPGHAVEAEVVEALRDRQPAYVVALQAHELVPAGGAHRLTAVGGYYFSTAPGYYFILRDYIDRHYAEAARFGPYVILRRRDLPAQMATDTATIAGEPVNGDGVAAAAGSARLPVIQALGAQAVEQVPGEVLAWARSDDPAVQESLIDVVRYSGDTAAAAALVEVAARRPVTPRVRQLVLRMAGEMGDTQALPGLLRMLDGARADDGVACDLHYIASKALIQEFWLVPERRTVDGLRAVDSPELRQHLLTWLGDEQDPCLRFFAAWAAGALREPRAVRQLIGMLGESNEGLKAAAAQALAAIGQGQESLGLLVDEVGNETTFIPSIIIEMYRRDREAGAAIIGEKMHAASGERLELLCWIAGNIGDGTLTPGVLKGVRDASRDTRVAAAWALGELGGAEARVALEAARADADRRVRDFAEMALVALARRNDVLPRRRP